MVNEGKAKVDPLPVGAHVMCGWPLVLIAIGGAIGGGLGGAAYGINTVIYRSKLPVPAKILLKILTGCSAIGLWIVAVMAMNKSRT